VIIIVVIATALLLVLLLKCIAVVRIHLVYLVIAAKVPGGYRLLDQSNCPEPHFCLIWQLQYCTYYRHLLLLSQKTDTHFTIPQRELCRRLSQPSWLVLKVKVKVVNLYSALS